MVNVGEFNWYWLVSCWLQIWKMPANQSAAICSVQSYSQQYVAYIDSISFKWQKAVGEWQKVEVPSGLSG